MGCKGVIGAVDRASARSIEALTVLGGLAAKTSLRAARVWMMGVPGGPAVASILGCAAVCGSSVACSAAMGRIAAPEMSLFGIIARTSATGLFLVGYTAIFRGFSGSRRPIPRGSRSSCPFPRSSCSCPG